MHIGSSVVISKMLICPSHCFMFPPMQIGAALVQSSYIEINNRRNSECSSLLIWPRTRHLLISRLASLEFLNSFDVILSCICKNTLFSMSSSPYANRSWPVCSDSILMFLVRSHRHISGRFALTSAAGIGGQTEFPHLRTCSLLGYSFPV